MIDGVLSVVGFKHTTSGIVIRDLTTTKFQFPRYLVEKEREGTAHFQIQTLISSLLIDL